MPEFIEKLASKSKVIALIHHPLYLENGLAEAEKEALLKSEHKGLEFVTAVITTSPTTALEVTKTFGFQKEKIATVLPGVDRGSVSKPKQTGTINLLCVGSVIERKGHLVLIEALSRLKSLDWKLECIGLFAMDDPLSEQILLALENSELSDRITFHGAVPEAELESAYNAADVFVLPSFYEGYGMAYAEAIVRGLPVIGTKAGAIPDTVPDGCGLLIDPGNSLQLSRALETMISDADERNRFRMNAIASSSTFPTWRESAGKFLEFLEKFT